MKTNRLICQICNINISTQLQDKPTLVTLPSLKLILAGVWMMAVVLPTPHWPDLLSPAAKTLPRSVKRRVWLRPTAADTTVNSDMVSSGMTPARFSVSPTPSWPFSLRPENFTCYSVYANEKVKHIHNTGAVIIKRT